MFPAFIGSASVCHDLEHQYETGPKIIFWLARLVSDIGTYQRTGLRAATAKPNILFIMGDDIGFMQPSIYHRGLMVGETPNIDRIGNEGAIFMDYVAMQSCTSGRNAFFTGM